MHPDQFWWHCRLGNVRDATIRDMVTGPDQTRFGTDKRDTLPQYCRRCAFHAACNGGCPKHRFERTPDGEDGLNYLCPGYKMFFAHVDPYMQGMARELQRARPAANVMAWVRDQDEKAAPSRRQESGRNEPCPCGSGKKYKRCCGLSK